MTRRLTWLAWLFVLLADKAACQPTVAVDASGRRLSIQAQQVPLKSLLQQIAQESGIQMHLFQGFDGGLVNGSFSDVPMEEALMRLVRPHNLLIFYGAAQEGGPTPRIATLYLLRPSAPPRHHEQEGALQAMQAQGGQAARHLSRLIVDAGDITLRRQAIADLAALPQADAVQGLEAALDAKEPELRREVALTLGNLYGDTPPTGLGRILFGDHDAQVREAAIQGLAMTGGEVARLFIQQALKDPEERIREAARQALGELAAR